MKNIQGAVSRLGNATVNKNTTTYSIIEIGGSLLQKVKIPTSLDSFLTVGSSVTLHMRGKFIVGISLENGKSYCYKAKPIVATIVVLGGLLLTPLFGLGLIFVWIGINELLNYQATSDLESQGATPIST